MIYTVTMIYDIVADRWFPINVRMVGVNDFCLLVDESIVNKNRYTKVADVAATAFRIDSGGWFIAHGEPFPEVETLEQRIARTRSALKAHLDRLTN